jgi:signal transduction histidine kinase
MDNMGESTELAERIGSLSLEAQEAIGDIVWSTSPMHDSLKELLTRISDVASDMCSATGLTYEITMPPTLPDVVLSNEVRKSLLLIFKEAMNNIVKHAGATSVSIAATLSSGELRITIADDGAGFSAEGHDGSPRGHGLRNMTRRAEEIGARFILRSAPGKGTTIEILHKMT